MNNYDCHRRLDDAPHFRQKSTKRSRIRMPSCSYKRERLMVRALNLTEHCWWPHKSKGLSAWLLRRKSSQLRSPLCITTKGSLTQSAWASQSVCYAGPYRLLYWNIWIRRLWMTHGLDRRPMFPSQLQNGNHNFFGGNACCWEHISWPVNR